MPAEKLFVEQTINVNHFLNIDGVEVRKSNGCSAYSVWVALAVLPPILGVHSTKSFLFHCGTKMENFSGTLYLNITHLSFQNRRTFITKEKYINFVLMVSLWCRHDVLIIIKFSGYYGCGICVLLHARISTLSRKS